VITVYLLGVAGGSVFVVAGNDEPATLLGAPLCRAWRLAGAVPGWMSRDQEGWLVFRRGLGQGKPDEWPAFRFSRWDAGTFKSLPAPKQPFALDMRSSAVCDADFKELGQFNQLRALNVDRAYVSDAGLKELKKLTGLQALGVSSPNVTDVGLKELKELKGLQTLDLRGTRVTGTGFEELKELKGLRSLNLCDTELTDAGLRELKEIKGLQALNLRGNRRITHAGLD
jgi:hypothetical protein